MAEHAAAAEKLRDDTNVRIWDEGGRFVCPGVGRYENHVVVRSLEIQVGHTERAG